MFLSQICRHVSLRRILLSDLNQRPSAICGWYCRSRSIFQTLTHTLTIECPRYPEAIRAELMEKTRRGFTIEIDLVDVGHNAQFGEVEIGIEALERIEGPGDSVDTLCQNCFALRQLEFVTEV